MRNIAAIPLLLHIVAATLFGQGISTYGSYDLKALAINDEIKSIADVDRDELEKILRDLWAHARGYPPKFANDDDKKRAQSDAKALVSVFDQLVSPATRDSGLLFRAARLSAAAHNLDVKGAGARADKYYKRLIELKPGTGQFHHDYGAFLGGANRCKESVPHLKRAIELGKDGAIFSLAMSHLSLGEKDKAKEALTRYLAKYPNNKKAQTVLNAIENGKIEMKSGSLERPKSAEQVDEREPDIPSGS